MANTHTPIMAFGTSDYVRHVNEAKGIKPTEETKEVIINSPKGTQFVIADCDSDREVTEAELKLLDNVIIKNDYQTVFMQEDKDFYDDYYMSDLSMDNELLKAIRGIRRIYKSYDKYLYACYLRDYYLDKLDEMYGEDYTSSVLKFTEERTVRVPPDVFLPPSPIYSRNADDYTYTVTNGGLAGIVTHEASEEEIQEFIESWNEHLSTIDTDNVGISSDVVTDRRILSEYNNNESQHSMPTDSINVSDMNSMRKIIQSWHSKKDESKSSDKLAFPDSDEGIAELNRRYLTDEVLKIMEEDRKPLDDNEMVTDEVTNKVMTRREYNIRQTQRLFSEAGGWDLIKLMKQAGTGSKFERSMLDRKQRSKKRAKKQARDYFKDIEGLGSDYNDYESEDVSIEELRKYLMGGGNMQW